MDKMFKIIILIVKMMLFVVAIIEHATNNATLFVFAIVIHFAIVCYECYECYQFFHRK